MGYPLKRAAVMVPLLALFGCDSIQANSKICTTPAALNVSANAMTEAADKIDDPIYQKQMLEQCVHRWAYRLAPSGDPAPVAAEAVLAACDEVLFRATFAAEQRAQSRNEPNDVFDVQTGQSVNRYAGATEEMRRKALFHVVQARAGKCVVPG